MASLPGNAIFYAVLIAPGFVAVMTAVSLAAIEDDIKQFVLLVWSLVSSLLIDALFIGAYQIFVEPITSFSQFQGILFDPAFRIGNILVIFAVSLFVGVLYAAAILIDLPGICGASFRRICRCRTHGASRGRTTSNTPTK